LPAIQGRDALDTKDIAHSSTVIRHPLSVFCPLSYGFSMLKSLKIQIKKAACFFGRLRSESFQQIVNSKCPLTCPVLSCRPPPVTRVVAVHLPHRSHIKLCFGNSVKQNHKKKID